MNVTLTKEEKLILEKLIAEDDSYSLCDIAKQQTPTKENSLCSKKCFLKGSNLCNMFYGIEQQPLFAVTLLEIADREIDKTIKNIKG